MYKAIISLDKNADYEFSTITGESPTGLEVHNSTAGIIVTADEMFLVSIFYNGHSVAVVTGIDCGEWPKGTGVSLSNYR
ncbi:hypothetical protein [Sporomusa sphaeroides]|uniref:Uncharacterized protein n=1 Tax=Sporomusa sphaeroides DSM 2875 TaxID=1337886 RepID=A0A1U7M9Z4_9FIRM|nr:hypothetical protein [Sporomusa sphaeroides]OLS54342.1 hypothetical protein SPSPH_45880 [Sporomusa sphaeroides DSM 2875]CVK21571.1 hypothetical protein SSPH_04263 [Sporomusa sphaeroides DSM 2875]